jgi:hypothetical protein
VIRSFHAQLRRFATALAVIAALAFVLDGARATDHHGTAGAGGYQHLHSHGPAGTLAHHHAHGNHGHGGVAPAADGADVAALDQETSPPFALDGANCCCGVSCAAVMLPCLNAEAVSLVVLRTMTTAYRHPGDGIVPDGLRRPPRPLAIA